MRDWKLFQPITIKGFEVKNRLVLPPMCTEYASEDGFVTDQLVNYHVARAAGGTGFIQMENCAVVFPEGRSLGHHLGLDDDVFIPGHVRLVKAMRKAGGPGLMISCQLAHAGAQANPAITGGETWGPSEYLAHPIYKKPCRAMTIGEIDWIVEMFGHAARRSMEAGYDAVALQFAHGYLVSNFLSPHINRRTDQYGGSLENRARLALAIVRHVRSVVGDKVPIVTRLNAADFVDGGLTLPESKQVAGWLVEAGADVIDVSCGVRGSYQQQADLTMAGPEAALAEMAREMKEYLGPEVPVILCRRIQRVELAEQLLNETGVDMVAMGRAHIADPDLANKARDGRYEDIIPCIACNQACYDPMFEHKAISCLVNPTTGLEYTPEVAIVPAEQPKRVVVVGGGPSGMETARIAAMRGHHVSLFEKDDRLGGLLHLAAAPPRRKEFIRMIEWLEVQCRKLGVEIHLGTEVTPERVTELEPDVVVVATGPKFSPQRISGLKDDPRAVDQLTLLEGHFLQHDPELDEWIVTCPMSCCENKTFYGCDTVQHLVELGKKVSFATFRSSPYEAGGVYRRNHELRRFREAGVKVITGASVREVRGGVAVARGQGKAAVEEAVPFDAAAFGTHLVPNLDLYERIRPLVPECYAVGNCVDQHFNAVDCMREATFLGRRL